LLVGWVWGLLVLFVGLKLKENVLLSRLHFAQENYSPTFRNFPFNWNSSDVKEHKSTINVELID
jgi:hypothetical protein